MKYILEEIKQTHSLNVIYYMGESLVDRIGSFSPQSKRSLEFGDYQGIDLSLLDD